MHGSFPFFSMSLKKCSGKIPVLATSRIVINLGIFCSWLMRLYLQLNFFLTMLAPNHDFPIRSHPRKQLPTGASDLPIIFQCSTTPLRLHYNHFARKSPVFCQGLHRFLLQSKNWFAFRWVMSAHRQRIYFPRSSSSVMF